MRAALDLFEQASAIAPDAEIMRALTVIALRLGDRETASRYYKNYSQSLAKQTPCPRLSGAESGAAMSEAGLFKRWWRTTAAFRRPIRPETVLRLAKAYIELRDLPAPEERWKPRSRAVWKPGLSTPFYHGL